MGGLTEKNIEEKVKSIILEFLEKNEIPYDLIENNDNESICIDLNFDNESFESDFYYAPLMIETSDKDVYRVYPYEIMHIAIEDRETVLYLTDDKVIRTNYNISYWENILSSKCFQKPHHSYIVNLNYVTGITQDYVFLRCKNNQYTIYTSKRKIRKFKKTFLNFGKEK